MFVIRVGPTAIFGDQTVQYHTKFSWFALRVGPTVQSTGSQDSGAMFAIRVLPFLATRTAQHPLECNWEVVLVNPIQ